MIGRKKTVFSLFALVLVLILFLSACSTQSSKLPSSSKVPSSSAQSSGDKEEAKIDTSKPEDLIMWMVSGSPPPDQNKVMKKVNEILKEKLNVTLTVHQLAFDSEMQTKYRLLLSGGEQVDIIQGSNRFFNSYVGTGAYQVLNDYLPIYAPDIWEQQSEYAWKEASYKGKIYAIPSLLKMYNPYGVIYRKDLQVKYNVKPVTDFVTLEEYLDAVLKNDPDMLPFNICGDEYDYLLRMMRAYCGWDTVNMLQPVAYVDDSQEDITKVFNFTETDQFVDYCKLMKSWKDKGYWSRSALSASVWSRDNVQEDLSSAGIDLIGNLSGTSMCTRIPKNVEGAELDIFDWPSYRKVFHFDDTMGDASAFPINGIDLPRALMVHNALMTDKELYMLTQFGFEGEHYINDNGNYIMPEGLTIENHPYSEGALGLWPLRNSKYHLMLAPIWTGAEELWKKYDGMATENKLSYFIFDATPVQNQIAAVEEVNVRYLRPLLLGMMDDVDSSVAEYRSALKKADADAIFDEVKRQITVYAQEQGF